MFEKRQNVRVIMKLTDSAIPLDADTIADAFAQDLQSDTVSRWADGVRDAIAAARLCTNQLNKAQDNGQSQKRTEIKASIAALQRQLLELERH